MQISCRSSDATDCKLSQFAGISADCPVIEADPSASDAAGVWQRIEPVPAHALLTPPEKPPIHGERAFNAGLQGILQSYVPVRRGNVSRGAWVSDGIVAQSPAAANL